MAAQTGASCFAVSSSSPPSALEQLNGPVGHLAYVMCNNEIIEVRQYNNNSILPVSYEHVLL